MTGLGRCAAHCEARWTHCQLQPAAATPVQPTSDAPRSQLLHSHQPMLQAAPGGTLRSAHGRRRLRRTTCTTLLDACRWRVGVRNRLRSPLDVICDGCACDLYCCDRRTRPARRVAPFPFRRLLCCSTSRLNRKRAEAAADTPAAPRSNHLSTLPP